MKQNRFSDSINHAVDGIIYAFKTEKHLKIHFFVAILMLAASLWLNLNTIELLAIFLTITMVLLAEMFNTAIEAIVNLLTLSHHPLAKISKDVAAGGVLLACINALVVAWLILHSQLNSTVFKSVYFKMKENPIHVVFLLFLLIVIIIIIIKALGSKGTFTQGGLISGHAAFAFATSTAILCITKNKLATGLAFFLAILIAQSRVEARLDRKSVV